MINCDHFGPRMLLTFITFPRQSYKYGDGRTCLREKAMTFLHDRFRVCWRCLRSGWCYDCVFCPFLFEHESVYCFICVLFIIR
jgi:hypothetical protein